MKAWEELGTAITKKWGAGALTPGLAFFIGGIALLITRHAAWAKFFCWVQDRSALPQVVLLLVALSAAVAIFGHVVGSLEDAALRLLEGYWPSWCKSLAKRRVASKRKGVKEDEMRFNQVAEKAGARSLDDQELREYLSLQESLMWMPEERYLMPTKLGNVLRAAETRPLVKYGLDGVVLWPRLWFVLPDLARKELIEARKRIESAAQLWLWGVMFWVWGPFLALWFWVPIVVGSIVVAYSYSNMIRAARVYAELFDSIFDLYRRRVYDAIGWPAPKNPEEEHREGQKLTQYLVRGSREREPTFFFPVPPKS
jgi:hypothetical protein